MGNNTASDGRFATNNSPEAGRMEQPFEGAASDMDTECFEMARRVRGMAWAYERIARDAASTTDAGQNLALIDLGIAVLDYVDRCMKDLEAEAERRMILPAKS